MNLSTKIKTVLLLVAGCLSFVENAYSAAAITRYTPESVKQTISSKPKEVLFDFEDENGFPKTSYSGDTTNVQINLQEKYSKFGRGSFKLSADENADNRVGGTLLFDLYPEKAIDLSNYQALSFWFYVPPEKADYFYGRYDIRMRFFGDSVDKYIERAWPAVKKGWNWYVWEFSNLEELPVINKIAVLLGPVLEGFGNSELFFDHFTLVPMDKPGDASNMAKTSLENESWSSRYNALKILSEQQGIDSLGTIIQACGDDAQVIRSLAVKLVSELAAKSPGKAFPYMQKALMVPQWRPRLAAIKIVANIQNDVEIDAIGIFYKALLDDNYYVRDFAFNQLLSKGQTKSQVAETLMNLSFDDHQKYIPAIRRLSEIGPRAKNAIPFLLDVLRNKDNQHLTRCWALRAIWEIDESYLAPSDWTVALSLKPGEVHYHLLNRVMDRLEQASSNAVAALIARLHSPNSEVRSRACVILGNIGQPAEGAVDELKRLLNDEWYVAWEADNALAKILPHYSPSKEYEPDTSITKKDITVKQDTDTTFLSNGIIELVFKNGDDSPGPYIVRRVGGINLFESDWINDNEFPRLAFRHSKSPNMIERQWLQRLNGSPFSRNIKTGIYKQTPELVDYMVKFIGDDYAPIEFEYHYVLKSGDSGFYIYVITRNVTGKDMPESVESAQIGIGRFITLVALTKDAFDYVVSHDKLKGPAKCVKMDGNYEGYPDIYQCTYRMPTGEIAAKHEWGSYELFSYVRGYSGKENGGVWLIFPSYDFQGDSMPRSIKTGTFSHLFIPHLESKYYIGQSNAKVTGDWEKYYGPMYFYINDGKNTEEMWIDAKRQAQLEVGQWPYDWLKSEKYHDRGTVKGNVKITDGSSPEGAYVVLANPTSPADPDQFGLWMRNVGPYHYWVQAKKDGSFEIPNVHKGSYNIYAFKPGVYGEYSREKIKIASKNTLDAGLLEIEPIQNGKLIWQIGIPDGGAMEFKNGRNYHQWDNYIRYREDFPEDVHYIVGQSDWTKDWNYIHPASVQGENAPVSWKISFDMEEVPENECLLSIMCGGRGAEAKVLLNDIILGDLKVNIGHQHVRTAPYGELVCRKYNIDPEKLRQGTNTIEITFPGRRTWTRFLSYDFLRLEEMLSAQ